MLQYFHYSQKDQVLVCKAKSYEETLRFHLSCIVLQFVLVITIRTSHTPSACKRNSFEFKIQLSQQLLQYFLYLSAELRMIFH